MDAPDNGGMSPPPPSPPSRLDEIARKRIQSWIAATGVSQAEISRRVDRTGAWLSRYLRGEFDADLETLQRIARVFGHSLAALLDVPTDPVEEEVLSLFRACPQDAREAVLHMLRVITRRLRKPGRSRE